MADVAPNACPVGHDLGVHVGGGVIEHQVDAAWVRCGLQSPDDEPVRAIERCGVDHNFRIGTLCIMGIFVAQVILINIRITRERAADL